MFKFHPVVLTGLISYSTITGAAQACGDIDAWEAFSGQQVAYSGEECAVPNMPVAPPAPRAPAKALVKPAPDKPPVQIASIATQEQQGRAPKGDKLLPGVKPTSPPTKAIPPVKATLPSSSPTPNNAAPHQTTAVIAPANKPASTAALTTAKAKERWDAKVGQTLWRTVSAWSARSGWKLDWQASDLDYPIEYPLQFEGSYEEAVAQVFNLYADAQRSFIYEGSTVLKTLKVCEFKASTYQGQPKCK